MSIEAIEIIKTSLASLGINYEFATWTKALVYPYFVGEYQETEPMTEDGLQESTFILTGFTRGKWLELEEAKETIENYFNATSGNVVIAESGSAVAIFYASSLIIPTGDAELKKIQINLNIKEWKV